MEEILKVGWFKTDPQGLYNTRVSGVLRLCFKEMLLLIGFIDKRELPEAIKKWPITFTIIFLIRRNRLNPLDSVPLATLQVEIL